MAANEDSRGLHHLVFPERQVDEPTKRRRRYDDDYMSDDADDHQPKRLRKDLAALSDWSLEVTDGDGFSKTFRVHRATLASASPYFHAAFTTPMRGRRASSSKLRLPPLCCTTFESALDFIYDGALPDDDEDVQWLCAWLAIARELDVPSLRDAALEQLHKYTVGDGPTPENRERLMVLYAHAIQLGLEKLQRHCEQQLVASPEMRGAVETYDVFPAEAILRLAGEATTQESIDIVAETNEGTPDRPSGHEWAAALIRRRLCGDSELADGDVRALLDGLAGVWAQLWTRDTWSCQGRIDHPDEAVTLLRLSVEYHGGCFLSAAGQEPITADETARESEDLWEPTEEDEQDIVQGCIFPTDPTFYGDKVKDYDESALLFTAATLEYMAAELLEISGHAVKERLGSNKDAAITERDIFRAIANDMEVGYSLKIHAGRCVQAQVACLACSLLGTISTQALARLPLDVVVLLWASVLRKNCHEDVVFDSIRGYLEATSAGPEARARAWRTCSFAHLSATKMAAVMENFDEFGLDSSTLLKASIAARYLAEGTSESDAKARGAMQGLTFNERKDPPAWVPRATFLAGSDRVGRPFPYLEIG
jgi:hypothetical protein